MSKRYNDATAEYLEKKAIYEVNHKYGHFLNEDNKESAIKILNRERRILKDFIDKNPDCEFEVYTLYQINTLRGKLYEQIDSKRIKEYAAELLPGTDF